VQTSTSTREVTSTLRSSPERTDAGGGLPSFSVLGVPLDFFLYIFPYPPALSPLLPGRWCKLPHSPPVSLGSVCPAGTAWGCQSLTQWHSQSWSSDRLGNRHLATECLVNPAQPHSGQGQASHPWDLTQPDTCPHQWQNHIYWAMNCTDFRL